MHAHDLSAWQHDHHFGAGNESAERSTRLVLSLIHISEPTRPY